MFATTKLYIFGLFLWLLWTTLWFIDFKWFWVVIPFSLVVKIPFIIELIKGGNIVARNTDSKDE